MERKTKQICFILIIITLKENIEANRLIICMGKYSKKQGNKNCLIVEISIITQIAMKGSHSIYGDITFLGKLLSQVTNDLKVNLQVIQKKAY